MTREGEYTELFHPKFELPNATPKYPRDTNFRIENLSLSLHVDLERREIEGKAVYTLKGIEGVKLENVSLDAKELTIDTVKVAGKVVPFTHIDDTLSFGASRAGREFDVEISYHGKPESGMYFVAPVKGGRKKPVQAWTQGEDEYSKFWYPCFDEPNMKFTTDFHITVKRPYIAVSNGELTGVTEDRKGRTYHWRESVPHSSYLNSVAIGDFALIEDDFEGIPVQYYVEKGREEEARRSFGKTPDMMKFFSETIGVDYPYEKYAQVAVADFIWGGMENVSCTTQTDETLHDERAENDYPSHPLVAHELAHQWWGDLVTTRDWSNVWLNEGFATYFQSMFHQHDRGEDEFEYHLDNLAKVYFAEDGGYRRPIVQRTYYVPAELFDRTTYQKGALVLHMLRTELGDRLFRKSLRKYCLDNRMKNVETSDLIKAISEATGRNMQPFFDQWIFSAGFPELKAKYSYSSEKRQIELRISQTQKTDELTKLFSLGIDISIQLPGGKRREEKVRLDRQEGRFTFEVRERPLFVSIDPHNNLLKKMEYERPVEDALNQLSGGSSYEKVQAARELAGKSRSSVVEGLRKELTKKNFWGVHAECAEALAKLGRADALEALLAATPPDSRARKVLVRAIGAYRDGGTAKKLESFLDDNSYAVQAEAVTALSTLRDYDPRKVLTRALGMKSHLDVVMQAALGGYAESGTPGDVAELKKFTTERYGTRVRVAAVKAIAKLGKSDEKIRRFVYDQLRDESIVYRRGAIEACAVMENPEGIQELEGHMARERDGRLKRTAMDAIARIRRSLSKPDELRSLTSEMEDIKSTIRELRFDIEALQKKVRGKR